MSRCIVCIDDDRDVLRALERDLRPGPSDEFVIELAESAKDAEDLIQDIESNGDVVALVICDQVMPGEDGVTYLSRLRVTHPETKKILLTGYAGLENTIAAINNTGLDRYLEKPWDGEALVANVRQLLLQFESETTIPSRYLGDVFDLSLTFQRVGPDLFTKVAAYAEMEKSYREKGYYLWQRPLSGPCERVSRVWDPVTGRERDMVMAASNNYLGLTTHPRVVEAAKNAIDEYGVGTGAVALLSGTLKLHRELEERLCAFKSGEACVLFPSGFAANVAIITALARKSDVILLDELVHASIIDGSRASRAKISMFAHNDTGDLEKKLIAATRDSPSAGKLIIVDGVYSMDGDIAPVPNIISLARKFGAKVMVDEAHSVGVIGQNGGGIIEHFGLTDEIDLVMGTLSKTFGCTGGYCVAKREIVEYIRTYGRPHMFSTSLPPATVASVIAGLDILQSEPEHVQNLRRNADYVRKQLQDASFDTGSSETAIIPIIIGDDELLPRMAKYIDEQDVYLNTVLYPVVPRHNTRLRASLMATHTPADLDRIVGVIKSAAEHVGFFDRQ